MSNGYTEFLKSNNSSLFYTITGEGDPLVFIHGFNDSRIWEYQVKLSSGGSVAVDFSLKYPELVKAL